MSDDDTPLSVKLVRELMAETRAGEREWRDEVRSEFRLTRQEVSGIRDRLAVIETSADGGAALHQALEKRVAACELAHGQHASRDVVAKLAHRPPSARRLSPWAQHTITALVTTAATTAVGVLLHRGWISPDQASAAQASMATPGGPHGP